MIKSQEKKNPTREHVGVYGIHLKNNNSQVLLVLKGRGPYKGMYDLPGGGIEKGETKERALTREYEEEIGSDISSHTFLCEDLFAFPYVSTSEGEVNFQHKGYFYTVVLPEDIKIKTSPDGHDSMGAIYVDVSSIVEGSVIVAPMAKKAILMALDATL